MRHIGALQRGLGFALVGDGTLWALAVNGVWVGRADVLEERAGHHFIWF